MIIDPVKKVFEEDGKIAVYGAGYVGLALATVFLRKELKVILVDIDENRLNSLKKGGLNIFEAEIREAVSRGIDIGSLKLTLDGYKASKDSIVKVVTVPVYLNWNSKSIDYTSIMDVSKKISKGLKEGDLVIYESSMPPGTMEKIVKPILEDESGLKAEGDFYLAYSPERIFVGRAVKDIEENYPKIVSGIGSLSLDMVTSFYNKISKKGVIALNSVTEAEFEKLAEGIYRDVNIALANELALAAMKLGVDYYSIRKAANSQPYCNLHLPGPGVGGPCIPVYPYFMINILSEMSYSMDLTMLSRRINESMPNQVLSIINSQSKKYSINPKTSKISILGIAFRRDIDDTRLSPSLNIISLLVKNGYNHIVAHDPYVKSNVILEKLGVPLTKDIQYALEDTDIVIIATGHKLYRDLKISDILKICNSEPLIIDTKHVVEDDLKYKKLIILGKPIQDSY